MKKKELLLCLGLLCMFFMGANAKNALVIIAHGAPMNEWNRPVLSLESDVKNKLKEKGITRFDYVKIAFMEFSEPSIYSVVKECEQSKVDSIYVIPLFIAPSAHTEQDIPIIAGHAYNAKAARDLNEEGTKFVSSSIPIVIGPTLYYGDVLEKVMAERIREMSKDKANEAILFLAHGDPYYVGFWKSMMERIGEFVKNSTGIRLYDYAFVAMGNSFKEDVAKKLVQLSKSKKRILVQGVYLSSGVKAMAEKSGIIEEQKRMFNGKEVEIVYGQNGILPGSSSDVCSWIIERAAEF